LFQSINTARRGNKSAIRNPQSANIRLPIRNPQSAIRNRMISSSSVIHPKAQIGQGCVIGPFCVLGENVVLGNNCRLQFPRVIDGHTELGEDNEIFPSPASDSKRRT